MKKYIINLIFVSILILSSCSSNHQEGTQVDTTISENIPSISISTGVNYNLYDFEFMDPQVGFIVGGNPLENKGKILKTSDQGTTWNEIYSINGEYFTSLYISNNILYATSSIGKVFISENNGDSWNSKSITSTSFFAKDVIFKDNNEGYIVGSSNTNGVIYKTTNGGNNWNIYFENNTLLNNNPIMKITPKSSTDFLLVGGNFTNGSQLLMDTTNNTLSKKTISTNVKIFDISLKEGKGFMVGNNGKNSSLEMGELFFTNDFAENWSKIEYSISNEKLNSVDFVQNKICIAGSNNSNTVNESEFIRISYDNGVNWKKVNHEFNTANWQQIKFITPSTIIAIGHQGKIIKINI